MKLFRALSVVVMLMGFAAVGVVLTPALSGQSRPAAPPAPATPPTPPEPPRPPDTMGGMRMLRDLAGAQIGVTFSPAPASAKGRRSGIVIQSVAQGSPADKAGLKAGDVVVEFDGERVRSPRQFARLVRESTAGASVKLAFERGGQKKTTDVMPVAGPAVDMAWLNGLDSRLRDRVSAAMDRAAMRRGRNTLGLRVEPLTPQLADYFGVKAGVLVADVAMDSSAARAGVKAGDVITSVDGTPVRGVGDLRRPPTGTSAMTLGVVRDRKELTLQVAR